MNYRIKEIYFTQQGEGKNTGKDFVFVRFAGCNLWSGKEKHRASAICKFCDTDFYGTDGVNGGIYETKDLVTKIKSLWISNDSVGVLKNSLSFSNSSFETNFWPFEGLLIRNLLFL